MTGAVVRLALLLALGLLLLVRVCTQENSADCVRLWEDWAKNRQKVVSVEVPPLSQLDKQGLKYWLSRFVMEVRTKKREKYDPNSLHHSYSLWNNEASTPELWDARHRLLQRP